MPASISRFAASLMLVFTFFISCKKSSSVTEDTGTVPDLQTTAMASVSGFVTDESNVPVAGAAVKMGTASTVSDQNGHFTFSNVQVIKNAAVVTVSKQGYFNSFRTFIANGPEAFFRIQLSATGTAQTLEAATGGEVTFNGGLKINLPANSVMDLETQQPYTGTVSLSAKFASADEDGFPSFMPGDKRGIDNLGKLQSVNPYQVAGVELYSNTGRKLQIQSGKSATITLPISAAFQSAAPASVNLWHFNESNGLWQEDGIANRTGNDYVATVSHFSFWGCSPPLHGAYFSVRVIDSAGNGVPFAFIKLTDNSDPQNSGGAFTGPTGETGGVVPANTSFTLTITNGMGCSMPVHTQQIQSGNGLSLGSIMIPNSAFTTVSGSLLNCALSPVTNGHVLMDYQSTYYQYNVGSNGTFNFNTILCGPSSNATLIATDRDNQQQSTRLSFTIHTGSNALGGLQACGVSTIQYINYTIDGNTVNYSSPNDSFAFAWNSTINAILIQGSTIGSGRNISFAYSYPGSALGSSQALRQFFYNPSNEALTPDANSVVHITQYDPPGGFIAGNFSGTMTGPAPANTVHTVSFNFRVRRSF